MSVGELVEALEMSEAAFEAKYGFERPQYNEAIVTHCGKGGRAAKAEALLKERGFKNVQCYSGSFADWKANNGDIDKS